uniref:Uncharacterized protein n=1 Tax=Bracon brevicornis TaxID=1563983 RepID=A0A6V7IRL8_9HYME
MMSSSLVKARKDRQLAFILERNVPARDPEEGVSQADSGAAEEEVAEFLSPFDAGDVPGRPSQNRAEILQAQFVHLHRKLRATQEAIMGKDVGIQRLREAEVLRHELWQEAQEETRELNFSAWADVNSCHRNNEQVPPSGAA